MRSFLAQDWVTIRGNSNIDTFTQGENEWIDLAGYQDVVAWLDVKEFTPISSNTPAIAFQTSPTKDDALFFMMAAVQPATTGVTMTSMLKEAMASNAPPLARWFRWQITVGGAVAWDITFRLWIAVNRIGGGSGEIATFEPLSGGASPSAGSPSAHWLHRAGPNLAKVDRSALKFR